MRYSNITANHCDFFIKKFISITFTILYLKITFFKYSSSDVNLCVT